MRSLQLRVLLLGLGLSFLVGCAGTLTPSHQDATKYTALDHAVENCDLATAKVLIAENPGSVNELGWGNTTPLHLAALNNCTELAAFLIAKGADVNAKAEGGATPLHLAAQKGNLTLVRLLLLHKADVSAVDDQGRTPQARATEWGHSEVAGFLGDRRRSHN